MRNRFGETFRAILILLLCLISIPSLAQKQLFLPGKQDSVRFAVMGDTGTGGKPQYEVARELAEWRTRFPFEFVLMMGDNLYGGEAPSDYRSKFEIPYKPLLDADVKFYEIGRAHV